jgi:hypothetical protein
MKKGNATARNLNEYILKNVLNVNTHSKINKIKFLDFVIEKKYIFMIKINV